MPRRPYRFEDFGRAGRYRALRGRDVLLREEGLEPEEAQSSDEEFPGLDVASDAGSDIGHDLDGDFMLGDADEGAPNDPDINRAAEDASEGDELNNSMEVEEQPDSGDEEDLHRSGDEEEDSDNDNPMNEEGEIQPGMINGELPLYANAPVTVGESMYMVLTFALAHKLTGKCIADLLNLVSLHCIQPNNCLKSLYHFKKFFANVNMPLRRHYYCGTCLAPLEVNEQCNVCGQNTENNYFITVPITPQLRSMYRREGFYAKLQHRFVREKVAVNNLEDIYDSEVYLDQCRNNGFLSDPNAISFCWNTDGVPVYKSSKYSIWPFYLRINELPYQERVRKDNIMLAGLWFGFQKPLPNLFLLPLLPELRLLHTGIQVEIPQQNPINIKAIVLYGTCDMPAKALFMNFKSYNGYYGCTACKQRGERTIDNIHVYRYENNFQMRTDEETEYFAELAAEHRDSFLGVKGISILSRIAVNPVVTTAIDPMHKYSGLTMKLLSIWLSSQYSDHNASISNFFRLVDRRLTDIKPPNFIERLPRSFKHLKYKKISELKAILLIYGIPILHDLLPPLHFNHFKLLVGGLYLLNKSSVSPEDIELGSALLKEFVAQFEDLYGLEHMTCNVHQLLHLGVLTRRLGPLFVGSCAPFETMNGILKDYVHGTRYAELQICTAASLYMNQTFFKERDLREDGPVQAFCESLACRQKRLRLCNINERVSAADKMKRVIPLPEIIRNAFQNLNVCIDNVFLFKKVYFQKRLYTAESYTMAKKTNSSCVKFFQGDANYIGIIQNFVRLSDCHCHFLCECRAECYAIVKKYDALNTFSTRAPHYVLPFIYECRPTNNIVAVKVEDFVTQCFHIDVADLNKIFVVEPINNVESDD